MPRYEVIVREYDDVQNIPVDQNTRDIAESIKEHIQEQFDRSSVTSEEVKYHIEISFEVAPRPPQHNPHLMRGEIPL